MKLSNVVLITYYPTMSETTLPTATEQLAAELAQRVFELAGVLEAHVGVVLRDLDLTAALADVLWKIDPAADPPSRRELAARLQCDPSNVTFLADRLEARGLIERVVDDRDRRLKAMRLTPAGAAARSRLLAAFASGSPFARLTAAEQRHLADLLARSAGGPSPVTPTDDA